MSPTGRDVLQGSMATIGGLLVWPISLQSALAAAISRKTPGRDQQRDMVVALRFGDGELDRHRLQERRIRGRRLTRRVVAPDLEAKLIAADRDRTAADERGVGAAVLVC